MRTEFARLRTTARNRPTLVDTALALALYAVVTFAVTSQAELEHARGELVSAIINGLLVAPLALRRKAPVVVLATVGVAAAASSLSFGPTGGEAAVLVALGTVVSHAQGVRPVVGGVAGVVAAVLALLVLLDPADFRSALATTLTAVTSAVAVGLAARARRAELEALRARAEQLSRGRVREAELAAATERARIARELHDVVAHNVSVMVALADGAQHTIDGDPARARTAIGQVAATGREALEELRELLGVMRPDGDADRAPQPGLDTLDELVDRLRAAGLDARLCVEGARRPLAPLTEMTVYRIVQEALTNALKHGRDATRVDVRLAWSDDAVAVEVVDDGSSGARAPEPEIDGRGLTGMRERASVHGVPLEAGRTRAGGWRVATSIPLRPPVRS